MVRLVVENILLFGFLALIPTQLGRHFWMEWSTVAGVRSDYLSPTLYLVDVVWVCWIILEITKNKLQKTGNTQKTNNKKQNRKMLVDKIGLIILVVTVNIVMAENRGVAGYRWLRIGQWLATVWMLRKDREKVWRYLGVILPVWIIGEVGLGIAQVAKNGSLQGLFYWLGERKFDYMTIGVATMSWMNEVRVRAYGTFSHPNSLAGFLLIATILQSKIFNLQSSITRGERIIYWITMFMGLIGIVLAGSRVGWILVAALLIFNLQSLIFNTQNHPLIPSLRKEGKIVIFVLIGIGIYFLSRYSSGWDTESWGKRVELMKAAGEMIRQAPLLGVGAGNFVGQLPYFIKGGVWWIQPVHNVLVLGLSEIGVVGMGMMGWLIIKISDVRSQMSVKKVFKENWMIIVVLGVTGISDHYWLTLPQNSWLLAVVAAII